MADVSIKMRVTGLDRMEETFTKSAVGMTYKEITPFEKTLKLCRTSVTEATHVETGVLRLSVRSSSHFDGDEWSGEVYAARYPGIFELARGDAPTKYHPYPGNHFFFNAVEPYIPEFADNVDAVWRAQFGDKS